MKFLRVIVQCFVEYWTDELCENVLAQYPRGILYHFNVELYKVCEKKLK
jgi:hypothetical protein